MEDSNVAIIGASALPIGNLSAAPQGTLARLEHDILAAVAADAISDAGVTPGEIDAAIFTQNPPTTQQLGFATFMTAQLGIACRGLVTEVNQLGLTGGVAFDIAAAQIASGQATYALALGVVRQSSGDPNLALDFGIRAVGDVNFQAPFGLPPVGWYALDCRRYMEEFGVTRAEIAGVAVKSRRNAADNPIAQFRDPITLEQVLAQRMIAEPLGLYEVPSRADGAICLVLASESAAKEHGRPYVAVEGRGFFHEGHHQIADCPTDVIAFPSATMATSDALKNAGLSLQDIDLFELYAPCTITEVLVTEAIGLFPRGEGCKALLEGVTEIDGRYPVNSSGGCLSRGHPPQLTGLYGLYEIREQLLGKADRRQVSEPQFGLHCCELGNYNATLAHILGART